MKSKFVSAPTTANLKTKGLLPAGSSNRDPEISPKLLRSYRRFLPHQFMKLLGKASVADVKLGDSVELNMTILFADIRDFTSLSESMSSRATFRFINDYLKEMEPVLFDSHGFIDKYIGDGILGVFPNCADDAVNASLAMLRRLREFNKARQKDGGPRIEIGLGVNTGLAMVGAVGGHHRIETTVIGDSVNLTSRIESLSKTYGVPLLISEHSLYSLEKPKSHDIRFIDRVRVKGKEQPLSVYEVFDADPPKLRTAKRRAKPLFEEALANYHCREISKARRLLRNYLAVCPEDRVARIYAERCSRFQKTGLHEATGEIGTPIVWSEKCKIGHQEIDDQHRELFIQVNKFFSELRGAKRVSQVESLAGFLRKYVVDHFETEERVMQERGYPLLALQQTQHARFKKDFAFLERELSEKLSTQRAFMLFKIQLLVVDWIANHTMKLDRHFGKYLAQEKIQKPTKG